MAFNAGTVKGELDLDAKGFVDALRRAQTALDRIEKNTKQTASAFTKFRNALSLMRDALLVIPGLFRAITAPFRAFIGFMKEASNSAAEFEVTTRKLSTALALAGNTGVGKITERLKAFANELQETTGIGNTFTLQVAQTLTVLGVQEKDLQDATTAVIEYSEATGRNAVEAARQFGKTLGGSLGELSEALPALRSLSKESLMAGGAFKFALNAFQGTAEAVANTTTGLKRTLESAFGDLTRAVGEAFNPVLNAILKGATSAVKSLTDVVNRNKAAIRDAFQGIAETALNILEGISNFAVDVPTMVAQFKGLVLRIVAEARIGLAQFRVDSQTTLNLIKADLVGLLRSFAGVPLVGESFARAGATLAKSVALANQELAVSRAFVMDLQQGATIVAAETKLAVQEAEGLADAIRNGTVQTGAMAVQFNTVKDSVAAVRKGLSEMDQTQKALAVSSNSLQQSVERRLAAARKTLGIANETTGAIQQSDAAVRSAAAGAGELASNLASAAGAAGDVANAAASAGGGGGTGVTSPSAGRQGGSVGLNLSNPQASLATLDAQLANFSNVTGRFSTRAARNFINQLGGQVQGQIYEAFSTFTSSILDELNRAGIFDPQARQALIDERIAEAQRLGVLPSRRNALPFSTGI